MGAPPCTGERDYTIAAAELLAKMRDRKRPGAVATTDGRTETSGASLETPQNYQTMPTSSDLPGGAVPVLQGADSGLPKVDDTIMPRIFSFL